MQNEGLMRLSFKHYSSGECVFSWRSDYRRAPVRGEAGPSRKSLARLRRQVENAKAKYRLLVTLTYPAQYPCAKDSKEHLRIWAQRILRRKWATSALWVLEFQQMNWPRCAPHYHVLLDGRYIHHKNIAESWVQATRGMADLSAGTEIRRVRKPASMGAYMCRYLKKSDSKHPVTGEPTGRAWGVYGDRKTRPVEAATVLVPRETVRAMVDAMVDENVGQTTRRYKFPSGIWYRNLPAGVAQELIQRTGGWLLNDDRPEK